jgi:hypothetical protein
MELIKRVFQGCALVLLLFLLGLIGAGGMLLDLLNIIASALAAVISVGIGCWILEDPDE